MKKTILMIFSVTCFLSGIISFFYLVRRHRDIIGEYYAKSSINVEMDKQYAQNIALTLETSPAPRSYWLSPTTAVDTATQNIVMQVNITLKKPYWNPAIQVPEENAERILESIDHIAMFVGNKLFYFSQADIQRFEKKEWNGYALFYMPGIFYEKSLVFKNWSNYYGDINFGIKALSAFFLYPARFAFPWFFLLLLLFLHKKPLRDFYAAAMRNKNLTSRILLVLMVIIAFLLRWNGYVRHSGWTDEIYSAVQAANPNLPFISTFNDAGNPPLYFILLRIWFILFGWTESAGTMLSVLLGTGAVFTLYAAIKPFAGKKAALYAAFFTAVSGFAIGYSQEMRAYILKMFLVPLVSLAFLNLLKNISVKNAILYLLPSVCIVNSHYYGIILVMANYAFFTLYLLYNHMWKVKRFIAFTAVNILIALSFLPYFLYMVIYRHYDFMRPEFRPALGHSFLFGVIVIFAVSFFVFRRSVVAKIKSMGLRKPEQLVFAAYMVLIPAFIFTLSYGISFFKPMITFRYLWPINAPFFFTLAALFVCGISSQKKYAFAAPLFVYMFAVGLNGIIPFIPGKGSEGYKEARAYIAADAAAHPNRKSVMLENTPQNAAYYGFETLPSYTDDDPYDVLYVLNDISHLHEMEMYENIRDKNITSDNWLKIHFNNPPGDDGDGGMLFKKYHP